MNSGKQSIWKGVLVMIGNWMKKLKANKRRLGIGAVAVLVAGFMGVNLISNNTTSFAQTISPNTIVDPDTTNAWENVAASSTSTQNIGRIWTDKSVFDNDYSFKGALGGTTVKKGEKANFLVALSALSSTSNLKSTVTNTTPLDIVLVLDVSGSMDDPIGEVETTTYEAVYDGRYTGLNTRRTYYVRSGNDYIAVTWEGNYFNGSWQDREGNEYEPRTSRNDNNRDHVQFYQQITASESAGSKINALKNAANGFAETFATMNDNITDASKQHRISVVKFSGNETNQIGNNTYRYDGNTYNYSQVVSDLSSYTTETVSSLERTINSLNPDGSTRADYGLSQAERVLNGDGSLTGARADAQKVVIFFTDGEPNGFSGWDGAVAADAINNAHDMKQDDTLVYTIGVFEDANPSDTNSDFNRYMNAVSSNYPEAECTNWLGQQSDSFGDLNLGDKVQGEEGEEAPQYYYSATNAVGLEQVFKDITESLPINDESGSPIEEEQGAAGTPGYLTFTDTLGSYMEVVGAGENNDKLYLAFADGIHEGTTSDGGKTWKFSGVVSNVNNAYPEGADLSTIVVTVEKNGNLETGDTITVKIPASLIPMRHYDVDTDNNVMNITDTYPVRLFYGVNIKNDAVEALKNPGNEEYTEIYNALIENQTSEDGKTLDFYSNSFSKNSKDGLTTARFTPSEGNKFYYYPANAQLFTDPDCTQPATAADQGSYGTLYYKDSYWQKDGDGIREVIDNGSITRSEWNGRVTNIGGNLYTHGFIANSEKPQTLVSLKTDNTTNTASNVLAPNWVGIDVSQHLGNNGKLSYPAPGQLEITKTVDWGNASDDTKEDVEDGGKNGFTFNVHLYTEDEETGETTDLTGSYPYAIYETDTDPIENGTGTITNNGSITLKDGQRVVISGLPDGTKFEISENEAGTNGFETTYTYGEESGPVEDNNSVVDGTIEGGTQQSVEFENAYSASDVSLGTEHSLKVQKILDGRDWQDDDEFRFTLNPEGTAPEPETSVTTIDSQDEQHNYTVDLSDITFTEPGTFTYVIEEDNDTNPIPGIDYSNETYAVTITVTDNKEGALEITDVKFVQRTDFDGHEPTTQPEFNDNTVVFTNKYDATEATTNLNGAKVYTDTTGSNPNAADKFTFELKAVGGYETGVGSAENPTIDSANVPMPENADENTHTITIGNRGTNRDGFAFPTITYDGQHLNNTYIYEIREVIPQGATDNSDGTWSLNGMKYDGRVYTIEVAVSEAIENGTVVVKATPNLQPTQIVFTNTYDPTDITISKDTQNAIHGTKILIGRNIKNGETFYFQLKQTGGPETILENPVTKTVTQETGMDFWFDDMTFSKVGEYTFEVNEVADDQGTETTDGNGMTYSQNVAKVTVNVSDNKDGTLKAEVQYANQGSDNIPKAVFTNNYKASVNYGSKGGIVVTKQLLNRPMNEDEFTFTITESDDTSNVVEFTNPNDVPAGTIVDMAQLQTLTFDQTDAGKTFTYVVDEVEPSDENKIPGVTYDQSQYKVEILVLDNGDGSMHTETTVTKIMNANGSAASDVIIDSANSDAENYLAPKFGFVNTYDPNPAVMGEDTKNPMQVTKVVTGAPSPDGVNYSFTLTATGDNVGKIQGLNDQNQLTVTTSGILNADNKENTDDDSQTLNFGELKFTEPGHYTFTVQENAPDSDDGWTFDTDSRTITVEVLPVNNEGKYDGNLHIGQVIGNNPSIYNRYTPGEVVVGGDDAEQQITVQKTVTGKDSDSTFEFQLNPVDEEDSKWQNVENVDQTASITEVAQDASKQVTFGELKFKAEGTYEFTVHEVGAAEFNEGTDRKGWTYDEHSSTVTIEVTDKDFDGSLEASVSYDNSEATTDADKALKDAAAFTNKYETTPAVLEKDTDTGIGVQKKVTGAPNEDDFTFSATFNDQAQGNTGSAAAIEGLTDGKLTATIQDDFDAEETKDVDFGTVTFTEPGVYVFDVKEDTTTDKTYWTYDDHTEQIVVTVTDQDGKLVAEVENNDPLFTNSYTANEVTIGDDTNAGIIVQKTLSGRAWENGDAFAFEISRGQDNTKGPLPAETSITISGQDGSTASSSEAFGSMTFTKDMLEGAMEKDFSYVIKETSTDAKGVTVDSSADRTVTVTVTDPGNGQLEAKVTYNNENASAEADKEVKNAAAFTNRYNTTETTGTVTGFTLTKVFENHEWTDAYSFQFKLTPVDGAPMPSEDAANGVTIDAEGNAIKTVNGPQTTGQASFDFGNIVYEKAGTYKYTVSEVVPQDKNPGITYDTQSSDITVTVTDKDSTGSTGQLVANVTYISKKEFKNTYGTGTVAYDAEAGLKIVKNMTGRAIKADDFVFTMTGKDDASKARLNDGQPLEFKTKGAALDGNTATETIDALTNLEFTNKDAGKTYTYIVKETIPEGAVDNKLDGVTYDSNEYEVQFVVTEDGKGTLNVETLVDGVSQGNTQAGIQTQALPAQLVFDNSYDAGSTTIGASGTATINAVKLLKNDILGNYAPFTFNVVGQNNQVVSSGTNDTNGSIVFSDITYTTENLNEAVTSAGSTEVGKATVDRSGDADVYTFTYTVSEDTTNLPGGVSADTNNSSFEVTVTVTDDRKGHLDVEVSDNAVNGLQFINIYGESEKAEITLKGNKIIASKDGLTPPTLSGNEYQFTITGSVGAPMPGQTTVYNDGSNVEFGPITYTFENVFGNDPIDTVEEPEEVVSEESDLEEPAQTEETTDESMDEASEETEEPVQDETSQTPVAGESSSTPEASSEDISVQTAGRTKTFTYTITESSGSLPGVVNDTTVKTVTVVVTDEGNGTISAEVTPDSGAVSGNDFTFTNTYSVTQVDSNPTDSGISIKKTLEGKDLTAGEYTFQMDDGKGNVIKATNGADGSVVFQDITFTEPGTYTYTVSEVDTKQNGIKYDLTEYTATATVTDNSEGALEVKWTMSDGQKDVQSITFKNQYDPMDTAVQIGAIKRLDGRELTKDQFTFQLIDENDKVVSSVKNTEKGAIQFDLIEYDKEGTYTYTVKEVNDEQKGITYDETVYKVTVEVVDDQKGHLNASVAVTNEKGEEADLVFTNEYKEESTPPTEEEPSEGTDGEDTATQTFAGLFASLMGAAASLFGILFVWRKRMN